MDIRVAAHVSWRFKIYMIQHCTVFIHPHFFTHLREAGRYAEGLTLHRNRRFAELKTHIVASMKLVYINWLSHENVACVIGADDSRTGH